MHPPHFVHGPISQHCLAVNVARIDGAEVTAVVRHVAMVAQNEIAVRRDGGIRIAAVVLVSGGHVVFLERLIVHIYLPAINAHMVARYRNYPFNETLRSVARIAEDNDISTRNGLQAVDELIDEDALLVVKSRHHANAFHFYGLINKNNDEAGNHQRNHEIAQPYGKYRFGAARAGILFWSDGGV